MKTITTAYAVPFVLCLVAGAIAGCSSDPGSADTTDAGDAIVTVTDSRAPSSDVEGSDSKSAGDEGVKDTGASVDATPISADCKTYCDCFEANCAKIQAIPGGLSCPAFCAGFTKEQWTCRNAHCQLVVPEKNPGHCQHAVGIDQCM